MTMTLMNILAYNSMRQQCGLRRARSFADLQDTIDSVDIQKLAKVYQ